MKVAFVHPDLGIGGAERLVVDAAVGLQRKGHQVTVFTSHHDKDHCFQETRNGTLKVVVHGDFLPRSLFSSFFIVCAILRGLYLALRLLLSSQKYDVIVCDQLSVSVPLLKRTGAKVLFYCHYPDKLLSAKTHPLKRLYRLPVDWVEEATTKAADRIVVNSQFTASVFQKAFPSINGAPSVLYPPINLEAYDVPRPLSANSPFAVYSKKPKKLILSFNRFERKKNVALAILTFAELRNSLSAAEFKDLQLVVAGGYDKRVSENVGYHTELAKLADVMRLTHKTVWSTPGEDYSDVQNVNVIFLPSFSEEQRSFLLGYSLCLLYTPSNEHFGIVPCEAMYSRMPVIAVNNGGPTESIVHEETGLLVSANPKEFAAGVKRFLPKGDLNPKAIGEQGRKRVKENFSLDSFTRNLEQLLLELCAKKSQ